MHLHGSHLWQNLGSSSAGHPSPGGCLSPLPPPVSAPGTERLWEGPYGKEGRRWPAHCRNASTMRLGRALRSEDSRDGTRFIHMTQPDSSPWKPLSQEQN